MGIRKTSSSSQPESDTTQVLFLQEPTESDFLQHPKLFPALQVSELCITEANILAKHIIVSHIEAWLQDGKLQSLEITNGGLSPLGAMALLSAISPDWSCNLKIQKTPGFYIEFNGGRLKGSVSEFMQPFFDSMVDLLALHNKQHHPPKGETGQEKLLELDGILLKPRPVLLPLSASAGNMDTSIPHQEQSLETDVVKRANSFHTTFPRAKVQ